MADEGMRAILVRLEQQETRLAEQERVLAAYRAAQTKRNPEGKQPRYRATPRLIAALCLALLLASAPIGLLAADRFSDVPASSDFHDAIGLIAAAGITKGCNPPDYTQYCPKDYVTREQMAAFIARTAGLGSNPCNLRSRRCCWRTRAVSPAALARSRRRGESGERGDARLRAWALGEPCRHAVDVERGGDEQVQQARLREATVARPA